jgi:hypothetical protein
MMRLPVEAVRSGHRVVSAALAIGLLLSLLPVASTLGAASTFNAALDWPAGGWVAGTSHRGGVDALNPDLTWDSGYRGTVHFTSSDPLATLPADYAFTAADAGRHDFDIVLRTTGNQTFAVTDTSDPSIRGTSDATSVVAAAASRIAWVRYPTSGVAGVVFGTEPAVSVADAFGNTVTTPDYSVDLESWVTTPGVVGVLTCAGGNLRQTVAGRASFSGCAIDGAGTFELRSYSPPLAPATGGYVAISAGSGPGADRLSFSLGASSPLGASVSFAVSALAGTATDPSYRGTVHFTSTDAAATLPADYTFTAADAGRHTFSVAFGTSGSQTLTATDTGHPSIVGSAGITIDPGSGGATLELGAVPATIDLHGFTLLKVAFTTAGVGAGATIGLFWASVGLNDWTRVTTLTASAGGGATYSDNPAVTVDYRAVCEAGCPGGAASIASNRVTVGVRHLVTLTPVASAVRVVTAGTRLTYTATVEPAASHDRPRVTFFVYQKVRGAWVLRTQRTVLASAAGVARYARTWSTRGEWYIRARVLTDGYNAASNSPMRRIRVV